MPPKRATGAAAGTVPRARNQLAPTSQSQTPVRAVVDAITAPENRSLVRAIGIFVTGVTLLQLGFGEYLLPEVV